jgi:hypothetical protein
MVLLGFLLDLHFGREKGGVTFFHKRRRTCSETCGIITLRSYLKSESG